MRTRRTNARATAAAAGLAAIVGCSSLDEPLPTPENRLGGQVVISGPLRGAQLSVDQLDLQTGQIREHVGDTVTGDGIMAEAGRFELDVGSFAGILMLTARGGVYDDVASGVTIQLDLADQIQTVTLLGVAERRDDVLVSPVGHLVASRFLVTLPQAVPATSEPVLDAYAAATASVSGHFGRVADWTRLRLAGLEHKATSPTEPVRAALVHAALSYLVHDIAVSAGASPQEVNVLALTRRWAADLSTATYSGDPLVFDGNDGNSKLPGSGLQLGVCAERACMPDQGCDIGEPKGVCRSLCDLYSGTPRSLLGGELTKIISDPTINRTELSTADILPVARAISESTDRALFGEMTCTETLDRVPPTVTFDNATPAPGAPVRGAVTVKVTASDNVDVAGLVIEGYSDTDGDPSTAVAVIDTTTMAIDTLTVTARASDRAGNQGSAMRVFVVDNQAPDLVVADTGFVVVGGVRWSVVGAPVVSGTASDAHGASIDVSIGGVKIGTADASSGAWSVTLPPALLSSVPTDVTFIATDPLGNTSAAVVRRFAVDTMPPSLSVIPTTVSNETKDRITFAPGTGTPSHEHTDVGRSLLDGSTTCADVFKHAYLMEPNDPNPIRWQLRAVDDGIGLVPASARYRIATEDGTQVGPWRVTQGTLIGNSLELVIDAVRSGPAGDAFLGTTEAVMAIELEVADQLGRTASIRRCWTHHPLAVPLATTNATVASGHRLALSSNRLETGAPFRALATELINFGSKGLSLMDYELANGTLETSFVTFTLARPPTMMRRDYVKQSALEGVADLDLSSRIDCDEEPPAGVCGSPVHPPRSSNVGSALPVAGNKYAVRVFELGGDGALGTELPCSHCDGVGGIWQFSLAGKPTPTAPPRRYRVMTVLRELQELAPSGAPGDLDSGPFAETSIGIASVGITGKRLDDAYVGCTRREFIRVGPVTDPEFRSFCTQHSTFQAYRALTRVEITLGAVLGNRPSSAPTSTLSPRIDGFRGAPPEIPPGPASYSTSETLPPLP